MRVDATAAAAAHHIPVTTATQATRARRRAGREVGDAASVTAAESSSVNAVPAATAAAAIAKRVITLAGLAVATITMPTAIAVASGCQETTRSAGGASAVIWRARSAATPVLGMVTDRGCGLA